MDAHGHGDHDHAAELLAAKPKAAGGGSHMHGGSGEFAGLEGAELAAACATAIAESCSTPGNALALRVAALFIVGGCSALGVYLPLALSRLRGRGGRGGAPLLAKDRAAFFVFKAFGAGVILATGLVHMFPGAIGFLASPCLGWPSFSYAGTIASATIVGVMLIEHGLTVLAERRLHARLRAMGAGGAGGGGSGGKAPPTKGGGGVAAAAGKAPAAAAAADPAPAPADALHAHAHAPHPGRPHSTACDDVEATGRATRRAPAAPHTAACCPPSPSPTAGGGPDPHAACAAGDLSLAAVHGAGAVHGHGHTHDRGEDCVVAARHAAVAQVLELGIALHSVLIGISLGVARTACEVRPLLAAITFHQTFEGLALGGCLIEAEYSACAHAALGAFYALSTPLGIGLGLALSASYSPNTPAALAVSGVFDSVSAGILIYMALVDLIAADFASKRFRADGRLQVAGFFALALGVGLMSLLALWA